MIPAARRSKAGPTGLMLACELRLQGVRVAVLERLAEPDPTIKAGSINLPTASAFHRRGLLPELAAAQKENMACRSPLCATKVVLSAT